MKQSTKLLSLVLALIMAFSCMTVLGNAVLVESEVKYDSIDDAALLPEQVADMALDMVDDLLADADIKLEILVLTLDITSIDNAFSSLKSVSENWLFGLAGGLLKNVGALDFGPLTNDEPANGDDARAYKRIDGDIVCAQALLNFIGCDKNSEILSRVAYGMGKGGNKNSDGDLSNTAQLDIGLISSFVNLGEIGDMLSDIPGMLTELVYDLLVHGSYLATGENESYPSVEDLGSDPTLPAPMNSLDGIIDNALLNLIINPQEYSWEDADKNAENGKEYKDWDEKSVILPGVAAWTEKNGRDAAIGSISPRSNSFFAILDFLAPFAIDDIAINALNNNLKKALMEAVEIDLDEIPESALPGYQVDAEGNVSAKEGSVAADFEIAAKDGDETYVTYLAYDRMGRDGDNYYYTTMKTVVDTDANGDPVTDDDGNEVSHKERKYYKANMASGNKFASLINWKWEFVGSGVTPAEGQTQLTYDKIKKDVDGDGVASIAENINDLLALVYETALTTETKAAFEEFVGAEAGKGYVGGANSNIMTNIDNIAKYILVNFGDLVFGSTSPYASLTKEEVIDLDTVDLIAMIGPGFFEDVMPQIIFPRHQADDPNGKYKKGEYAFHDGVQIYEFGALVIREFISDITPNVNYDQYIFANGDVTSAGDRQFKEQGVDQWFNLILNMGVDIGYTYLYNITNFGDTLIFNEAGTAWTTEDYRDNATGSYMPAILAPDEDADDTNPYKATRWQNMLDEAIMWAVRYVGGTGTTSVLNGLDAATVGAITGPLNKLSYILNRILPLGFINGYSTTAYAFDISEFLNTGLKTFFTKFDLSLVLGLLGRNMSPDHYNLLADNNLINGVLSLVNDILGLIFRDSVPTDGYKTLLQCNAKTAYADGTAQSVDAVVQPKNLKLTVALLLRWLNYSSGPILVNALPVVGKLIKGWGTEQNFDEPDIAMSSTIAIDASGDSYEEASRKEGSGCSEKTVYEIVAHPVTIEVRNGADGIWRKYIDPKDKIVKHDKQYKIELVDVNMYEVTESGDKAFTTKYFEEPQITTSVANYGESAVFKFNYGTQVHPNDSSQVGGAGYVDIPQTGLLTRFEIIYKVYGEDGNAYLDGKTFTENKLVKFTSESDAGRTEIAASSSDHYAGFRTPQYVPYSYATDYVAGIDVAHVWRNQSLSGTKEYKVIPRTSTVDGLTMYPLTVSIPDEKYADVGIKLFSTYTAEMPYGGSTADIIGGVFGGSSGGSTQVEIKGSVCSQEEFETYVDYDVVSKTGDSSKWTIDLSSNGGKNTGSGDFVLKYYDDIYKDKLTSLVNDESDIARLEAAYYTGNQVVAANSLLESDNLPNEETTDDEDDYILRETNFTAYKWVDPYGAEVAESAVTPDAEDDTVGTATVNGVETEVRKVTAITASTAWNTYRKALIAGANAAYQEWNNSSVYNFKELYEALRVAVNDVEYLKNPDAGDKIGTPIDALKEQLKDVEAATTDNHNYTDYMMYRLNRLNDARDDANYYINLKNDASNANVTEVDERFPYTWIEEDDLRTLVANDETLSAYTNKAQVPTNLILALLEPMSDEEVASKAQWLADRKSEYAGVGALDVEMASVYLKLTSDRLLNRHSSVNVKYLQDEVNSINNMILNLQNCTDEEYESVSSKYSVRSWMKFEDAYWDAVDVLAAPTQKDVFDAKWELMCCRNELVLVEEEADYSELTTLMKQATFALTNANLYDNTAKELGQVLAELGICEYDADLDEFFPIEITNADGDAVNLFPGSAAYINTEPYSRDDQDVVNQKAFELKEALARLKFKQTTVSRVDKDTNGKVFEIKDYTMKEANETYGVEAEILSNVTKLVTDRLDAAAVKALFTANVAEDGLDVSMSIVSDDTTYSAMKDIEGFVGTDATITFYATADGVNIPVATVKLVVEGDVNGDGVLDVLDLGLAQLVSVQHAELEGAFLLAGDLHGNDIDVDGDDYSAVVNKAIA